MITGGFAKFRQALFTYISAQTFSLEPIFEEKNKIQIATERSMVLKVVVVPSEVAMPELGTRRTDYHAWRCRIHVLQILAPLSESERLAAEDSLMELTDEIEDCVARGVRFTIDGKDRDIRVVKDNPRVSFDSEAMLTHKMFWSSVEVELIDT